MKMGSVEWCKADFDEESYGKGGKDFEFKLDVIDATYNREELYEKLLDKFIDPKGVQIAIGSESQVQEMETCSLVTSTYGCGGTVWGALGVIGPRRMDYSRIIPLVDYSARLLTEILETQCH
jgi:heat-inducible transcriptional repressor